MKENIGQDYKQFRRFYTFIEPIWKKPEARAYTFLILSFFTCAFFLFFAIRPTFSTITGLRKQIVDSEEVSQKLTQKINALSQIQAEYEIIRQDLPILSSAMPDKAEVTNLVKETEGIVSQNQATLSAVQFQEVDLSGTQKPKDGPAIPVVFQITTGGSFGNLLSVMEKITKLPRLITVDSVNLTNNLGGLSATIRFVAYYISRTN